MPQPFTSDQLEAQLAASGQDYINRKDTVAIKSNKLKPSAIYLWHTNILPDTTAILAHLRTIGTNRLKANLSGVSQIKGESFSWKLNGKMPVDGTVEPVGLMNRGSGQTFYEYPVRSPQHEGIPSGLALAGRRHVRCGFRI